MNSSFARYLRASSLLVAVLGLAVIVRAQDETVSGNLHVTGNVGVGTSSSGAQVAITSPDPFAQILAVSDSSADLLFGLSGDLTTGNMLVTLGGSGSNAPYLSLDQASSEIGLGGAETLYLTTGLVDATGNARVHGDLTVDGTITQSGSPVLTTTSNGSGLTNLNASALTSGTVPAALLPAEAVQVAATQTLTNKTLNAPTFNNGATVNGPLSVTGNLKVGLPGTRNVVIDGGWGRFIAAGNNGGWDWVGFQFAGSAGTIGGGLYGAGGEDTLSRIRIGFGSSYPDTTSMEWTPTQARIPLNTASINPFTGALTVGGGAGIAGDLNVAGNTSLWGNIGIGTTTPQQRVEVGSNGGIGFSGTNPGLNSLDKKLYSPHDGDLEWMTNNYASSHGFAISNQGAKVVYLNTSGVSYLNGGNVGIGTQNPYGILQVEKSTIDNMAYKSVLTLSAHEDGEGWTDGYSGSSASFGTTFRRNWADGNYTDLAGVYAYSQVSWRGGLVFRTKSDMTANGSPVDRMVITPAGNVGIGTNTPTEKLEVAGNVKVQGGLTAGGVPVLTSTSSGSGLTNLNASALTTGTVTAARLPVEAVQLTATQTLTNKTLQSATLAGTTVATGNVGIQTSAPQGALTIGGGQLTVPVGSAAAPTYTFNDNLNTGLFSSGTNSVSLATNGIERFRVYGTGNFASDDFANLPGVVSNSSYKSFHLASPGVKGSTMISMASRDFSTAFLGDRLGDFIIGNEGARPIIFKNGMIYRNSDTLNTGTEQMRIDASGNVGIGTASPMAKLEVAGFPETGPGFIVRSGYDVASASGSALVVRDSVNRDLLLGGSANGGGFFRVNNVNSGTNVTLDTNFSNAEVTISRVGLSNSVGINFNRGGSTQWGIGSWQNDNTDDLNIYNGGLAASKAVTIKKSNSNVGIGTTTPTEKLEVAGNVKVQGGLTVGGVSVLTSTGNGGGLTGLNASQLTAGILPVARGGTGTSTPALAAGSGIQVTGTWPNQTVAVVNNLVGYTVAGAVSPKTALGDNASATDAYTTAIGASSNASGTYATAMGGNAHALALGAISIGGNSLANDERAIAFGYNAGAYDIGAIALGADTYAQGEYSTAVGSGAQVLRYYTDSATYSTAIGSNSTAAGNYITVLGYGASSYSDLSTVVGANIGDCGPNTVTIGTATDQTSGAVWGNVMLAPNGGRVGIGMTTPPTEALDVTGNAKVSGAVTMNAATVKTKLRIPPSGDLSMGEFTTGANPAN
jgi:hypothetical protein